MATPSTRQGLIDYALRQNGAPVLEINIEDDQISDLVDDAIQFYNERHMDGYIRTHLKVQPYVIINICKLCRINCTITF